MAGQDSRIGYTIVESSFQGISYNSIFRNELVIIVIDQKEIPRAFISIGSKLYI
jgi:hypothetical protein